MHSLNCTGYVTLNSRAIYSSELERRVYFGGNFAFHLKDSGMPQYEDFEAGVIPCEI
jgi:hypothetical protein